MNGRHGSIGLVASLGVELPNFRIVTIGTELESSRRAIDLAKRFDGVFAAVGWHPNDCLSAPDDVRGELEGLAKAPKVVAIGEIGIDHYRLPSTRGGSAADDEAFKARQVSLFQQQLEVAAKLGLNVVVHQRASFEACIEVFEPFADRVRGVFHCFVNDPAAARRVIDLGSLVSFTGVCTFKNAVEVRESLASVPLDKLMLETDTPFLGREALEQQKAGRLAKRLAFFTLDEPEVVLLGRETIYRNGERVGWLTSGGFGHSVGQGLGMGYVRNADGVDRDFLLSGNYELEVACERVPANLSLQPAYDPKSERVKM